jgi:guanylate kinase
VVADGKVCMLDIDMQGVQSVKKTELKPKYLFVQPPSFEVLEQRLRGRGTEKEEAVVARLEASKKEMEYGALPGSYDSVIINDDLETAYSALKSAIFA